LFIDALIKIESWSFVLLTGILLGLLAIPFLLKFKKLTGYFLTSLIVIMVLNLGNYFLVSTEAYQWFPQLISVFQPLLFLIGPIYYFYIQSVFDPSFKISVKHWPHFILFFLACYYHSGMILMPSVDKVQLISSYKALPYVQPSMAMVCYILIHGAQGLFYFFLARKELRDASHRSAIFDNHEFTQWVSRTNKIFGAFWLAIITWAFYLLGADKYYQQADYIVMLIMSLIIALPAISLMYFQQSFKEYALALYNQKYQNSTLSREQAASILKQLLTLMEKEKPYLDNELKISKLAMDLSVSTNLLSQVINQELNKNFFEFVNEYRIAEAMSRLQKPEYAHLSILGIAMEVGFNNKSTFNRLFKKHTGLTPSQFLRSHSS
jgi:AraC-like DNA-binding protein